MINQEIAVNELQIKNILTPIIGVIATWIATKLNFLGMDAATWNTLISSVVFGIVAIVLGYFNRTTNVLDAAGKTGGTTVVTTPQLAAALPENPDVIAATPQIVAAVKAA